MKIWQRYFLLELWKVFVLFISCFYFLYVLIDYSAHAKVFQNDQIHFLDIVSYYACQFTKRADVVVPIALMLATIKVLTTANIRHEIVALATGGISLKKIMRPFVWAALLCSTLLYLNFQFLHPLAVSRISSFEDHFFKERGKTRLRKQVNSLLLQDNSLLIYQKYDPEERAFFDVFWIKNGDQLCRIQRLFPYENIPKGKYVDYLVRTVEGEIVKRLSYEEVSFPEMKFDKEALVSAVHPPSMQSITQLARYLGGSRTWFGFGKMNDRQAESATYFYFKISIPLVCLLAVIGSAPFCLHFRRNLPIFIIYALSLCGIITFFTLVNSSVILGQSQVVPPGIGLLVPQFIFMTLFTWKYAKL